MIEVNFIHDESAKVKVRQNFNGKARQDSKKSSMNTRVAKVCWLVAEK